jgi:7-carboxy-7-deazaguanine synthase
MSYRIKEIFYSLQGEGANAGRAAVFVRTSGCNLWSGRESDRAAAPCPFCDTDFVGVDGTGGGRYPDEDALADAVTALAPPGDWPRPLVVLTGGEPALQVDSALVRALHGLGHDVAIETNGTRPLAPDLDWITVSPKAGTRLAVTAGDELKVVYPQPGLDLDRLARLRFRHFYLQPMDGPGRAANTRATLAYCLAHPRWRLSVQLHKVIGVR